MKDLFISAYSGIGDSIYQRPFIKALAKKHRFVYIKTPWPEFLVDIPNVKFIRPSEDYRTQMKNLERTDVKWVSASPDWEKTAMKMGYSGVDLMNAKSILAHYEKHTPADIMMDLPNYPTAQVHVMLKLQSAGWRGQPLIVVRPVTHRAEWLNTARSPDPKYVRQASEFFNRRNYFTVSIADVYKAEEWIDEPKPWCSAYFNNGELSMPESIELLRISAGAIGGVGWLSPAAFATKTPLLQIFGGMGAFNCLDMICDQRLEARKYVVAALPNRFCMCANRLHMCDKRIKDFPKYLTEFTKIVRHEPKASQEI